MNTLYIDCSMGAAGDMLSAALVELAPSPADAIARLNSLGVPGVEYALEKVSRCGIACSRLAVRVHGEEEGHGHHHGHGHGHGHCHDHDHGHGAHSHAHRSLDDVLGIVDALSMPDKAKRHAKDVYRLLAEAESRAHGRPVGEVHFHEVGALDAVADIAAASLLICETGADRIVASPVNTGGGTVRCAHGILPVPAPATAFLLQGVPAHSDDPALGELCTPTGAALLRHLADEFGPMPAMRVKSVGYGAGSKEFPDRANFVRVSLGETWDAGAADEVLELRCGVDDMTGEEIAFACERLFAAGALDVSAAPVQMKKGRPGFAIEALCRPDARDAVVGAMFRHTATIGIREIPCRRHVLARREETAPAPDGGTVRRKISEGHGACRVKLEHDDLARVARSLGVSIREAEEKCRFG